jgi:hypothetical protein
MSDVFERLRAANPVSDCSQPDLGEFLRRLDECSAEEPPAVRAGKSDAPGRRLTLPPARSWRIAAGGAIAVAVVLGILAVVGRSGGGISLVQRAYAATDPAGGIVYYVTSTRSIFGSGARSSSIESRAQVWRSGSRSRRVETSVAYVRDRQATPRGSYEQATERIAGGEKNKSYSSARNTIFEGFLAFRGSTSPESVNCRLSPACAVTTEDPVVALRELYAAGRVHEAGHAQLNGETLTVLEAGSVRRSQPAPLRFTRMSPSARILVDPKTGAPVEITTSYGPQSYPLTSTTIFHRYEHLELTAQTERLLRFRPHPHARLECVLALHCTDRESHGLDIGHT